MSGKKGQKGRKPTTLPKKYTAGWIQRLDRRARFPRQLQAEFLAIANDHGGVEHLSLEQRWNIEEQVYLHAKAQQLMLADVGGVERLDVQKYVAALLARNALAKTLRTLGRVAKPAEDLTSYLKEQYGNGQKA